MSAVCVSRARRRAAACPFFEHRRIAPPDGSSIRAGAAWEDAGMRTIQLRRYTLVDGEYDAFVAWWREWMPKVRPARRIRDRLRLRSARDERVRVGRERRRRRRGVPREREGVHGVRARAEAFDGPPAAGGAVQHPLRRRDRLIDLGAPEPPSGSRMTSTIAAIRVSDPTGSGSWAVGQVDHGDRRAAALVQDQRHRHRAEARDHLVVACRPTRVARRLPFRASRMR